MSSSVRGPLRRAVLLVAGTVTGLVLVLGYRTPDTGSVGFGSGSQSAGTTASASGTGKGGPNANSGSTASSTETVTGQVVNTQFGPVQVRVVATSGRISDVQAVALPNGDPRSSQISGYAGPQLRQQALATQSANLDGVAGASYTSQGYRESLQSALNQLGA